MMILKQTSLNAIPKTIQSTSNQPIASNHPAVFPGGTGVDWGAEALASVFY